MLSLKEYKNFIKKLVIAIIKNNGIKGIKAFISNNEYHNKITIALHAYNHAHLYYIDIIENELSNLTSVIYEIKWQVQMFLNEAKRMQSLYY